MYAHFQLFVHLDRFRNLDLFHQGEYALRVRAYSERSHVAARPVEFCEIDELEVQSSNPGGVNDSDSSFRVSSFYIRLGIPHPPPCPCRATICASHRPRIRGFPPCFAADDTSRPRLGLLPLSCFVLGVIYDVLCCVCRFISSGTVRSST